MNFIFPRRKSNLLSAAEIRLAKDIEELSIARFYASGTSVRLCFISIEMVF